MKRRQAAQLAAGDLHIGRLVRHADDQGEVQKIPVVRFFLARKDQPGLIALAVVTGA